MEALLKSIKEKVVRKIYWIRPSLIKKVETEAEKLGYKNDSALMNFIISQWFEK